MIILIIAVCLTQFFLESNFRSF